MIRRKSTEVLAIVLVLVMLVVSCLMPCFAEAAGGIEQQYESTPFGTNLITVDIQMDADDWQDMLDNALSETYYAADVTINGQTFENVGIRPKGNTSLTQVASSDSDCYSFKIEFDHYQDGQNREGFPHGGGMGGMWSGGSDLNYIDDDLDSYETIWEGEVTDTDDADHQRVVEALKKISEGDLSGVDVDLLCKYMAVQTFVVNLDSLSGNMAHNYYLYEKDGQLALLPWDYNLAFGGFMSGDASSTINFPIDTPVSSVSMEDRQIFAVILNDEDACALYHSYLEKLCTEYVQGGQFELTYTMLRGLLDSRVTTEEHDPTAFYTADEYTEAVEMLKTVIERRAESILGQLDGTIPSTTDGQQADSSTLVDASDLDLSIMGSQFGGGSHGGNGAEGGMMGRGGKMMPGAAGQQSEDTAAAPDDASQPSADTATDTTQTSAAQSAQPPEAGGEKPSGTPPDGQTPPDMASESNLSTTS